MLKETRNSALRNARQKRNWTQQDVAKELETSVNTVSRWELGQVIPSLYYRQKLCDLFGKNPQELGFCAQKTQSKHTKKLPETIAHPILCDPALPFPLQGMHQLMGRQQLIDGLVQRLCSCQGQSFALTGLPGIGKTALVLALACHPRIQQHFQGGILWAGLGQHPQTLETLHRWGELLGLSSAEIASQTSIQHWTRRLHQQIGNRRVLLILDDAWELADALVFQLGGEQCVHVLTTRLPALASAFAREQVIHLPPLEEEVSVALLENVAPQVKKDVPAAQLRELARVVGGLPLALLISR